MDSERRRIKKREKRSLIKSRSLDKRLKGLWGLFGKRLRPVVLWISFLLLLGSLILVLLETMGIRSFWTPVQEERREEYEPKD